MALTVFASLTIGSSEISMKIYEIVSKKMIRDLDNVRYPIELGTETYSTGKLSFNTVNTICDVLNDFKTKMKVYGVNDYEAIATSAIREASNCLLILDRIKLLTGMNIRVISNSEQRFLCFKAIALKELQNGQKMEDGSLILDIGAGSIQLSVYNNGTLNSTQNMKLGFLRIKEMLSDVESRVTSYVSLLKEYINNDLSTFYEIYIKNTQINSIIVISDNSYDIGKIFAVNSNYQSTEEFKELAKTIYGLSEKKLTRQYGFDYKKIELTLPVALIILRIIELTNAQKLWFPFVNVNDGLVVDYAIRKLKFSIEHDFSTDSISQARLIAAKYNCDFAHIDNVEKNALKIFDSINKVHGLGKRERHLLQIAVTMHSCGEYINLSESSHNSHNIIISTEIIGISHLERQMIANIVDYNFGSISMKNQDNFQTVGHTEIFDTNTHIKICKLAAIFRLANALDKSHKQKITDIHVLLSDKKMIISVKTDKDILLERCFFEEQGQYFSTVYGIQPELSQKK